MKSISGKEFAKILEKNGWTCRRINGSHHIYKKIDNPATISLPIHGNKSLKPGLLRYFLKVAKLSEKDL